MSDNDSDEGVASSDEGNASELGTKNLYVVLPACTLLI